VVDVSLLKASIDTEQPKGLAIRATRGAKVTAEAKLRDVHRSCEGDLIRIKTADSVLGKKGDLIHFGPLVSFYGYAELTACSRCTAPAESRSVASYFFHSGAAASLWASARTLPLIRSRNETLMPEGPVMWRA